MTLMIILIQFLYSQGPKTSQRIRLQRGTTRKTGNEEEGDIKLVRGWR